MLFHVPVGVLWGSTFAVIADRYGGRSVLLSTDVLVAVAGLGIAGYVLLETSVFLGTTWQIWVLRLGFVD